MPDFSEVLEELSGSGYTRFEAIQATVALSKIPQIEELLQSPVATEYMVKMLLDGFKPMNEQQKVLVDGIASFSLRERQCYILYVAQGMSMGDIAVELEVSKGTVQSHIERARKKLKVQQEVR